MEERREDGNAEYTGEYGNAIQGEYQEDTTYRYAYNGDDESTHSGDYYAGTEENVSRENQQENAFGENQQESSAGENLAEDAIDEAQNNTVGQDNVQDTERPVQSGLFIGNQNAYYQDQMNQNQRFNSGQMGTPFGGQNMKPPKKQDSFGRKLLVTVACAIVFGLVAGVFFNGFNYVTGRIGSLGIDDKEIEKTTVSNNDKGNQSASSETEVSEQTDQKDVAAIAEQTMPAVVAITSTTQGQNYYDLFGQYYQGRESTSSGTGFIVGQSDKELLIATNNHVVDNAKTISVQFIDGEIYEAQEKGADSANDLAVIAVNISTVKKDTMDKIKIADLGNSDTAKVGEMVVAIGNALGYGQSVTVGYISAKDREITEADETGKTSGNTIKALQTDAAINPGNSGGALINMQGQVIGINSAKIAASSVEGVGYAIPISVATPIIDELMKKEILSEDEKGYLGISGTEVTQGASVYNMPYGVYVKEVAEGGAADKGGIKVGDVITAINKVEVTTMASLQEKVNSYRKGTKIEVTIQRSNDGKYQEKKVTVELQGKESLDSLSDGDNTDGSNGSNGDNGSGNDGSNGSDEYDDFGSFWDFFR